MRRQRTSHAFGLLMIAKPPVRGALNLAWPFIRRFTERVFAEDRMAVEAEQRAWDEQGRDCNREVFPLILDVRDVLRSNGVRDRAGARLHRPLLRRRLPVAETHGPKCAFGLTLAGLNAHLGPLG